MVKTSKRQLRSKNLFKGGRPKMVAATDSKMKKAEVSKGKRAAKALVLKGVNGEEGAPAKPIKRKARVERLLKRREPQTIEHTKRVLVLKGHKTSETVRDALLDINQLTKPNNKNFSRKNEILPFEDISSIEFLCEKNQCSIFSLGMHTKKRPDNLILGRLFDGHLLDMYEFGVANLQSISEFSGAKKRIGSKPVMVFTGDQWESDGTFKKVGNLLLDLFRADKCDKISLRGLDHVISCSIADGTIFIRGYGMEFLKSGTKIPDVELVPMGPFMDLSLRRTQLPSDDLWKAATRKPRTLAKKVKNIERDIMGDKVGRIHMRKQNLDKMGGKRVTALRAGGDQRPLVAVGEDFGLAKRNTKESRKTARK
jgi:ribosome production factor 2